MRRPQDLMHILKNLQETQQESKDLGRNPTGFSQGMGIGILKGQQPGTAEVSTQQGFPLAVEKASIASLCRILQALLPMLTAPCSSYTHLQHPLNLLCIRWGTRIRKRNKKERNGLRNECRWLPVSQDDLRLPVLCPTTCLTLEVTIPRDSSIFLWFHSLAVQQRSITAAVLAACRILGPCHGNPCVAIKRTQQLNRKHRKEQSLSNTSAPQMQSSAEVGHGPKTDTLGCFSWVKSLQINIDFEELHCLYTWSLPCGPRC